MQKIMCFSAKQRRAALSSINAIALILAPLPALAGSTTENWTAGTGSWFTPSNWDNGVPGTLDTANILNGGTAQIANGEATNTPGTLRINGGSTIEIQQGGLLHAGNLFVGNGDGSVGTLKLNSTGNAITFTTLTLNNGTVSTTASTAALPTLPATIVLSGTSNIFSAASGATLQVNGAVGGSGGITIAGGGTVLYTTTGTYSGGTTINAGTLSLANGNFMGSGNTIINGGTLRTTASTSIGQAVTVGTAGGTLDVATGTTLNDYFNISGSGALALTGGGTLGLGAVNPYSGTLTVNSGSTLKLINNESFAGSLISANLVDNGTFDISTISDSGTTIASLSGSGAVTLGSKSLTVTNGTGIYTGTMTGSGPIALTGGQLSVNGTSQSVVTIANGGTLKGIGTIGGFTANGGGTVAPGNSIGTLNVAGNVSFATGSIYQVEVDSAGNADKIVATGTATINSGASVQVLGSAGTYAQATPYTIITATGGVTGGFGTVTSNLTFLTPSLSYTANSVVLTLTQTVTFPSVAGTPNQVASGTALQNGGAAGGALYTALLNTASAAIARSAFDAASGEIYATLMAGQFENAIATRRAMLDRMRGMTPSDPATGITFWGTVSGDTGSIATDGNAAQANHNAMTLSIGADTALTPNVRLGIDTGYSTSHVGVSARGSSSKITAGHVGGYANGSFDAVRVSGGFGYGFGDASVNRAVSFSGFSDNTSSNQGADTFQIFAEASYAFTAPGYTLEPFIGIDWTTLNMGAFREAGGSAALSGAGKRLEQATTTFGLALSLPMGGMIQPSFRAGLQHAFANDTAARSLSFISSGQGFTVLGTPLDADRAVIDANLGFNLGGAKLMAGYSGAFGARTTDHAIKATAAVNF